MLKKDFEHRVSIIQSVISLDKSVKSVAKKALFFIFLLSYVWKSVNIPVCLPAGKRKPPVGDAYSGEPHE
jgi:hypothetical protein